MYMYVCERIENCFSSEQLFWAIIVKCYNFVGSKFCPTLPYRNSVVSLNNCKAARAVEIRE